jgi:hemerythrin-like domain-containing protein
MDVGTRRRFLFAATTAAAVLVADGCARSATQRMVADDEGENDVGPVEDLMREHGILNRILLIYDEVGRRIDARAPFPADALANGAGIVRRFVEDYHEKLEEDFLFPRFERAGRLVELVATLRTQHQRGRTLTADVLQLAGATDPGNRRRLRTTLQSFVRMYRPHEAREDTVLFPALRRLVTPREYDELGERFEDEEHRRFGARGFEGVVDEVAQLERALAIDDLAQFTPA